MKVVKFFLLCLFFFSYSNTHSHNPEDFMIAEIERGQMYFENEEIAAEYGAALKRQRIRRLAAMPFYKKFYIFVKMNLGPCQTGADPCQTWPGPMSNRAGIIIINFIITITATRWSKNTHTKNDVLCFSSRVTT